MGEGRPTGKGRRPIIAPRGGERGYRETEILYPGRRLAGPEGPGKCPGVPPMVRAGLRARAGTKNSPLIPACVSPVGASWDTSIAAGGDVAPHRDIDGHQRRGGGKRAGAR